jgi:hypothetical protein
MVKDFKYNDKECEDGEEETLLVSELEKTHVGICYDIANYLYFKLKHYNPKAYFTYYFKTPHLIKEDDGVGNIHSIIVFPDNIYVEISMTGKTYQGIYQFESLEDIFEELHKRMQSYEPTHIFGGLREYIPIDKKVKVWDYCIDKIKNGKVIDYVPQEKSVKFNRLD